MDEYYTEKVKLQPITLHSDGWFVEKQSSQSTKVSRSSRLGYAIVQETVLHIAIPYEGHSSLWNLRPSTSRYGDYPQIDVTDDRIILIVSFPDDSPEPEKLKSEIEKNVKRLIDGVGQLRHDVEIHNLSASETVRDAIRRKWDLAQSVLGAVSALGIPMKRRESPLTFVAPIRRRKSPVRKPTVETQAYQPEPVLDETEYDHILEVMCSMSLVMERSPSAFATLDEEDIRTHFLFQLNGHYEGAATGETFNASGKTDILIRTGNKNIFVAECKFWGGPKAFNAAIDQLLGYLTWRDAKCALVVFNKRKNSERVSEKMHEVMESRSEHRRTVSHDPNGDSRYIFVKESEPGREITITTQLYDIPLPEP